MTVTYIAEGSSTRGAWGADIGDTGDKLLVILLIYICLYGLACRRYY